ncbi:cell division protein FtsA [Desulfobotulus sp.]|uniref:cell division protein FtsA n=1 Tax=Desulfobotulus sp. TaxID=1940337 RepID=UPI002A35B26B|nr:cell division protein FtsA [Desulfobotulus sp.]MDY0164004.1 cell division protein FtsA [Desulfobotulus sp.]
MNANGDIIVGLDIGTTKICAVVGEVSGKEIHIIGIGSHPSIGLRKGVVVNIESTVSSIRKAVEEAELMAGCEIRRVYAGIAGGHITGFNSHGIIAIKGPEVTEADVERVIEAARAVAIPTDREVIHVLPQEFIVDDHFGIQNPVGMAGVRLETKIHIVTGAVASAHNIVKCCNKAGLEVIDVVLEALASGEAVLSPEERELGTALIDFGGGTSDLAVFSGNNIRHTFILPLGGNNLTNDIAIGLRAPIADAERIKIQHGTCLSEGIHPEESIEVPGMAGRDPRKLPRQILGEIIEPRVEEIFTLLKREIYRAGMESRISSGIVLTGGGAMLHGVADLCESIFNLPTRVGRPMGVGGLKDVIQDPNYATAVGLVLYGAKQDENSQMKVREKGFFSAIIAKIKEWFKNAI